MRLTIIRRWGSWNHRFTQMHTVLAESNSALICKTHSSALKKNAIIYHQSPGNFAPKLTGAHGGPWAPGEFRFSSTGGDSSSLRCWKSASSTSVPQNDMPEYSPVRNAISPENHSPGRPGTGEEAGFFPGICMPSKIKPKTNASIMIIPPTINTARGLMAS
jgi:hypothetical protein